MNPSPPSGMILHEAEVLEQRIGLLEVCKTMSSLDNLADLSEEDISTYVYRIQSRGLAVLRTSHWSCQAQLGGVPDRAPERHAERRLTSSTVLGSEQERA